MRGINRLSMINIESTRSRGGGSPVRKSRRRGLQIPADSVEDKPRSPAQWRKKGQPTIKASAPKRLRGLGGALSVPTILHTDKIDTHTHP